MPITEQLQTAEQLQRAGLPHAAAVLIAEKIEAAAQTTHDTALDRLRAELRAAVTELRAEMAQLRAEMAQLRAEMAELRAELRTEMAQLESRIANRFGDVADRFGDVANRFVDLEKSIRTSQTVVLSAVGLAIAVMVGFGSAILTVLLKH